MLAFLRNTQERRGWRGWQSRSPGLDSKVVRRSELGTSKSDPTFKAAPEDA